MENVKNRAGWEILGDIPLEDFTIFRTKKSRRVNPRTGAAFDFFLIDGLDWANVIAITPENEVVLAKQYRHGAEQYTLELPGGCVEKDEDPRGAAARELEEEVGYQATELQHLGSVKANPAMMSINCHIYLARDVVPTGTRALDPGENIEIVKVPLNDVLKMVRSGEIAHGLHVAAFGLYLLELDGIRSDTFPLW